MEKKLRIVFMGTPDFAVSSLKRLLETEHPVVGVITAPDKPAGRGKKIISPPVKQFANANDISPVLQPANLKDPEFITQLQSLRADLQIVVAFRMLPEIVWAMPPKGTVNLHASLLPDYRGAAPINWAIINGEKETGVTTFFIEKEMDTGKIILNSRVAIGPEMSAGELHDVLKNEGAELVVKTLKAISDNRYTTMSQNKLIKDKELHPAPKIFKEDCRINWKQSSETIYNFIRGLSPYPAAWTELEKDGKILSLKIFKAAMGNESFTENQPDVQTDGKTYLEISTADGYLSILELQQAGKKKMSVGDFLRGVMEPENYMIKLDGAV